MSEFDIFAPSPNDGITHATDTRFVGKRASVCGYGEDRPSPLNGSGGRILFAECDYLCALQACYEGVQAETVVSEIDIFVSSTSTITLDHNKKLKNNTFVENNGHFDNEFDFAGTKGLDIKPQRIVSSFPLFSGHHASRFADEAFQGVFRTFTVFKKVRSSAASAEMTRQVEISTLSARRMAHGGVVPHWSSWTPAAYELEESSPPLDSHIGSLSDPPDGRREQGDKVAYILMGLTAGNVAGHRSGVINTGVEDILVLPAVQLSPFSLVLHFVTDSRSLVLGLRIVVPEALRRPSGQLLRQRQSLVDLCILAPISRSLLCSFTRSVREFFARAALRFLRLSCECVFRLLSTTYTIDSPAVGSRCTDSRASGGKLKLRMWSHEVKDPSFRWQEKTPGGERQHMRRRLAMTRPRASRSSSHRDERWEGCRV